MRLRRRSDRPEPQTRRHVAGRFELEIAGATVVGDRYPANFDVLHVDPELPFAAVIDGMGSGEGSRLAGATTAAALTGRLHADWPEVGARTLRAAVAEAQTRVRAVGAPLHELTGCTLTTLVAEPDGEQAWIAQLGDSRAYRLRDGLLELVTVDHTAAWLGLLHGWYAADSPEAARARYQLLRYVGHPESPDADLIATPLRPGDTWLLCTDGVTDQVDYHLLRDLLGDPRPDQAVRDLLLATLDAGGADNATAVAIRVHPR
ncbi:PP2C family protein-serine/threonine phosphatase [Micromonospora siamensis]|uniref:Serine/threonine protein phosphatase PrpC n=1 Tax=Micromonospora siamensis TaxID=299152 RepID=A0A1C5HVC8_9ACTN|nr:protein phosphatase 2C domain-containing protein [Micromonospora siamensis]SCG49949.1 Serine/threonine protein phosphatase PrpC [Micromonospora siamensis]